MAEGYRQPQYPSGNSLMDSLASLAQYNQTNRAYDDARGDKYQADTERYIQKTQAVNIGMLSQRALINQQNEVEKYRDEYLKTIKDISLNSAAQDREAADARTQAIVDALKSHLPKGDGVPKTTAQSPMTWEKLGQTMKDNPALAKYSYDIANKALSNLDNNEYSKYLTEANKNNATPKQEASPYYNLGNAWSNNDIANNAQTRLGYGVSKVSDVALGLGDVLAASVANTGIGIYQGGKGALDWLFSPPNVNK